MGPRRWVCAQAGVDALTFGLGSDIAGIAGVQLSQMDHTSARTWGQAYINRFTSWSWCLAA